MIRISFSHIDCAVCLILFPHISTVYIPASSISTYLPPNPQRYRTQCITFSISNYLFPRFCLFRLISFIYMLHRLRYHTSPLQQSRTVELAELKDFIIEELDDEYSLGGVYGGQAIRRKERFDEYYAEIRLHRP